MFDVRMGTYCNELCGQGFINFDCIFLWKPEIVIKYLLVVINQHTDLLVIILFSSLGMKVYLYQ
jgi:hypothetical protein